MIVLALDAATATGWALGDTNAHLPSDLRLGTFDMSPFKDNGLGYRLELFRTWLHKMIDNHDVDLIVFEAPILTKFANINMTRNLQGLTGMIEAVACARGLRCYDVPPSKIKKIMTGKGNAKKGTVETAARHRGFTPRNDHEADALGAWMYALSLEAPANVSRFDPISNGALQ